MLEVLVSLFIIAPLLPLLPGTHWSVRFFDFVRIQTGVLQIVLLCCILYLWDLRELHLWGFIFLLVLVILYQVWHIIPYTPFYKKHKPSQKLHKKKLTLLTANVLQTNTAYEKFIKLVKKEDPDIFTTMETDQDWDTNLSNAFPEYPHTVKVPLDNFYGMHLFSKIPFDQSEVKFLIEEDIPSIHCSLKFADQPFYLIVIHPAPPSPSENETSKERDAELMQVGKICRSLQEATIVCGDLNDVVWSKTSRLFKKLTGFNDPRIGRGLYLLFTQNTG